MPGGGGDHSSRKATVESRERERNVVELYLRGATFEQISKQLRIDRSTAYKCWRRALDRLPKANVEAMRKVHLERLQRMRSKIWTVMAGHVDPNDPTRMVSSSPELVNDLIGTALKIEVREAALLGLDAPTKQQIVATMMPGTTFSEEELDSRLNRLTIEEQHELARLAMKMEGHPMPETQTVEPSRTAISKA